MSQDLKVYRLELARLEAVPDSGDNALLKKILKSKRKKIERHDKFFASTLHVEPYRSLADALKQIVSGDIEADFEPLFQFEHAAVLLADALGEPLDSSLFMEAKPEFHAEVDEVLSQVRRQFRLKADDWPTVASILDRGPLLTVPLDVARRRLGTGYLTGDEVARAATAIAERVDFDAFVPGPRLVWPDRTLQGARQYATWLSAASSADEGLFFTR